MKQWLGHGANFGSIACSSNRFFFSTKFPKRLWAQPASYPEVTEGFSPAERRQGQEFIHSLSPTTEVGNEWNCTSSLPCMFHGVHKSNLTCDRTL